MAKEKADEQAYERDERVVANWARHVGVLTYFIAGSSVVSAIIFGFQGCEMRGQLDAMNEQAGITKAQISAYFRLMGVEPSPAPNGGLAILPVWQNTGGTVARSMKTGWQLLVVSNTRNVRQFCPVPASTYDTQGGLDIAAGNPIGLIWKIVTADELADIKSTKKVILISDHIQYGDIFPSDPIKTVNWCGIVVQTPGMNGGLSYLPLEESD